MQMIFYTVFFDKCMYFTMLCAFYLILCREEGVKILAFSLIYCTIILHNTEKCQTYYVNKKLNHQAILLRNVKFLNYKAENTACSLW